MHNTATGVRYNVASEDPLLAALPPRLKAWVLYDAPWNTSVQEISEILALGCTEDTVLRALRTTQREEARQFYGRAHPQAAQF